MDIKTLESYNLADAVKFHNSLNPKLWMNNRLRPEVKKQLKLIAEDFLEELGISGLDVVDLTISGSNAAYSYTPHSDLDLHILVDMKKFNDDVYQELFTAKKNIYNDSHDIKIHGIPVELYVQDVNQPVVSLGEYSLLQDKWLKIPSKRRANLDQTAVKSKYEKLRKLINHALKSNDLKLINNILKKIKQYRQAGLDKAGEFGPENLAYKILRNQDYITKLYNLRDKLHSEELTIETMYSTPGGKNKLLNRPALSIRKIAAKHNLPLKDILDQLKKGISVEKKHTTYSQTARDIALDHLSNDPKYYSKSQKIEVEEDDEDFDKLPKKVYHITPAENLDSIMSRGLLPKVGDRSRKILDEKPAVYCFPDKNSMEDAMMNWLGDEFDEDTALALLEIDTDGLEGHVTNGAKYEIAITSKISPDRIRILSKDLATPINESYRKRVRHTDEDYDPNGPPPGPEFKPTMPAGTVRVDVSDVYDWYKLGQHISNMKGLGKHDFGKGPPSTIMAFGSEPEEHKYIKDLEKTGLTTTDIDPIDPNQPKGMKRQKVDPTYNVNEDLDYMMGHCHVMALALKKLHPDWRIRAHIGWDEDAEDDNDYKVDHVYIVANDGTAYDCRGKFANERELIGDDFYQENETQIVDYSYDDIQRDIELGELKKFTKKDLINAIKFAKNMEDIKLEEESATHLGKLPKFFKNGDPLAELVPERKTHTFALHPDKWQSTFYSLTGKDPEKLKFYKPDDIDIIPGTLVGDMAIANQFYRAKTDEEKLLYALQYKKSLKPIEQAIINDYRMPELLIPKTLSEETSDNITLGPQLFVSRKKTDESLKPNAELWTSTAKKTKNGYSSAWVEWCKREMPQWVSNTGILFDVAPGARILLLRNDNDVIKVARKYGIEIENSKDLFMKMRWDMLSNDYDAIHHVPSRRDLFMSAWDVESTAWLNKNFLVNPRKVKVDTTDIVDENASGYIPSKKEANDPRYKTALTVDVKPDSLKKNAKAFGFNIKRSGVPPLLRENELAVKRLTSKESLIEHAKLFAINLQLDNVPITSKNRYTTVCSTIFAHINLNESTYITNGKQFIQLLQKLDQFKNLNIKVGSDVAIINSQLQGDSVELWGFTTPKTITKIYRDPSDKSIKQFEFNNDPNDVWPRTEHAEYNGQFLMYSAFFGDKKSAEHALTMLSLQGSGDLDIRNHIREQKVTEHLGTDYYMSEGKADTIAFHGTRNKIKSFQPFTHFGTFKAAKERLEHTDEGYPLDSDIIYKVDLNVNNPAHIDSDIYGNHKLIDYVTGLQNNKIINPSEAESIKSPNDLIKLLVDKGYDGISYKNKWEDIGSKSYVIFDPRQAKITDVITWDNNKMLQYIRKSNKNK